jgi:hypothetical protein
VLFEVDEGLLRRRQRGRQLRPLDQIAEEIAEIGGELSSISRAMALNWPLPSSSASSRNWG